MNVLVIGIAGGSGSGKSTLTRLISEQIGDDVAVMRHDDYYKSRDGMTYEERCLINYDEPDAYETDLMVEDLKKLKNGISVDCPVYDFSEHNRSTESVHIEPKKVILIDGILILSEPSLSSLMDIKVFVDAEPDIRILRRVKRDMKKRGRSFESVMEQYLTTVKPMHDMYVEPSKKTADIIIQGGAKNPVVVDLLCAKIRQHLRENET